MLDNIGTYRVIQRFIDTIALKLQNATTLNRTVTKSGILKAEGNLHEQHY
jgi:hypothetical protein